LTKALSRMTVLENLLLGPKMQSGEHIRNIFLRPKMVADEEAGIVEKAIETLEFFDLMHMKDDYAGALSGGQKRLLEMARALMTDPKMLLLDEPFAGVNPTLAWKLVGRIKELKERGMTFLIIEHDMPLITDISDTISFMNHGRIILEGPPEDVRQDPRVLDAYVGGRVMSILQVEGVVSGYTDIDILNGVSIHIEKGEVVSIIGPNGAGKSTLLKTIIGILKPRSGSIFFDGQDIAGMNTHSIVAKGMGFVPQEKNTFPSLTVMENLEMGAFLKDEIGDVLEEVFNIFPVLRDKKHQRATTLSGGEIKMLAMGRAMMPEPQVLLLDEPTAGLSPKLREVVFEEIMDINGTGTTILMVEQNAKKALSISHRGYVLEMGENRFEGEGSTLLEDENVLKLYLGG